MNVLDYQSNLKSTRKNILNVLPEQKLRLRTGSCLKDQDNDKQSKFYANSPVLVMNQIPPVILI